MSSLPREGGLRRFLASFLAGTVAGLGLALASLVALDPTGSLGTGWLPPVVFRSRVQKVAGLALQGPPPRALILGSSRAMRMEPSELTRHTGLPAFNAAVESARAEDVLGMLRHAVEDRELQLAEVVLVLDVQMFHQTAPWDARLRSCQPLMRALGREPGWRDQVSTYTELLSRDVVAAGLRSAWYWLAGTPREQEYDFAPDGFLIDSFWGRRLRSGARTMAENVEETRRAYRRRYQGFQTLSPERLQHLEQILQLSQRRGVRLRVFLTDFHPVVRQDMDEHTAYPELRAALVTRLEDAAGRGALSWLDAADRNGYGGSVADFVDGHHLRVEATRRILGALYRGD